jgi:hypothetical protein
LRNASAGEHAVRADEQQDSPHHPFRRAPS